MPPAAPGSVPLDDRGLLLADGLFETVLYARGALVLAGEHAERMAAGAQVLGLPAPSLEAFSACALASVRLAGLETGRAAVRVTLTAGSGGRGLDRPTELRPRLFATAATPAPSRGPALLVISSVRRNQASPASRLKTLAYLDNVLARREAAAAGADEAVMLNTVGEVACAAAANLFWLRGEVLFTPAIEAGRLDGIMARRVVAAAVELGIEIRQVRDGAGALEAADALFLTNSLIGVRPAHLLGGGAGEHRLVQRLAQAVSAWS
ncbi:MAG TPA: aminotransferase class IV [Caulobacteraceae bacterium]|nr:aminotransferase class IV [Caulobacteraceae bacterium]